MVAKGRDKIERRDHDVSYGNRTGNDCRGDEEQPQQMARLTQATAYFPWIDPGDRPRREATPRLAATPVAGVPRKAGSTSAATERPRHNHRE